MGQSEPGVLLYKRSQFVTSLPLDRLYTPSHYWLLAQPGAWRVGLTRFSTHLLGEIVDYGFDIKASATVRAGQVLGWIEGFKSVSDLYCAVNGTFSHSNPQLSGNTEAIDRDCYSEGWLYEANGQPDAQCVNASTYAAHLDRTIDGLLEKHRQQS